MVEWFSSLPWYGQLVPLAIVMIVMLTWVLPAAYGRYDRPRRQKPRPQFEDRHLQFEACIESGEYNDGTEFWYLLVRCKEHPEIVFMFEIEAQNLQRVTSALVNHRYPRSHPAVT